MFHHFYEINWGGWCDMYAGSRKASAGREFNKRPIDQYKKHEQRIDTKQSIPPGEWNKGNDRYRGGNQWSDGVQVCLMMRHRCAYWWVPGVRNDGCQGRWIVNRQRQMPEGKSGVYVTDVLRASTDSDMPPLWIFLWMKQSGTCLQVSSQQLSPVSGNSFHRLIICTNTEVCPLHYFDTFDNPIVKHKIWNLTLFVAYFLLLSCI